VSIHQVAGAAGKVGIGFQRLRHPMGTPNQLECVNALRRK
jgi:hypothetical protein